VKTEINRICGHKAIEVITPAQASRITGGGDGRSNVKQTATTVAREDSSPSILLSGLGLLGLARIIGVAIGRFS